MNSEQIDWPIRLRSGHAFVVKINFDRWGDLRHFGLAQLRALFRTGYYPTRLNCQKCVGTLDADNFGLGNEITILDIDSIVHKAWIYGDYLGMGREKGDRLSQTVLYRGTGSQRF